MHVSATGNVKNDDVRARNSSVSTCQRSIDRAIQGVVPVGAVSHPKPVEVVTSASASARAGASGVKCAAKRYTVTSNSAQPSAWTTYHGIRSGAPVRRDIVPIAQKSGWKNTRPWGSVVK